MYALNSNRRYDWHI